MITVTENQSLLDISIQEDGSIIAAFDWAIANGISITDNLTAGQKLFAPNSIYRNSDVANYFKGRNQKITTGQHFYSDNVLPGDFPYSL